MFYIQSAYISDRFEKSSLRSHHMEDFLFLLFKFSPSITQKYIFFKDLDGILFTSIRIFLPSNFFFLYFKEHPFRNIHLNLVILIFYPSIYT